MKRITLILLVIICTTKSFAQGDGSGGHNAALRAVHHNRPPRSTGGSGAAIASRAGYTAGISTASIIAGTAAVVLITLAALLIAQGSEHSH